VVGSSTTPVPQSARYYELAQWLRTLRRRSGLTYRQMSERIDALPGAADATSCSAVTLFRADRGTLLPRRPVVEAYAQVCGATRREARRRWEHAARGGEGPGEAPGATRPARRLEFVYQPAHLLEAMHRLRLAAGRPSLRELQKRAHDLGMGPLPRSTVADVLAGLRMPSEELLVSFVRACGQDGPHVAPWRHAWARAVGSDSGTRRRPVGAGY
jgi:hypothetical protein